MNAIYPRRLAIWLVVAAMLIVPVLGFAITEDEVNNLRERLADFNRQINYAYWDNASLGKELDLDPIYDQFADVLKNDRLLSDLAESLKNPAYADEHRSLLYLYKELSSDRIWNELSACDEEFNNAQAEITVNIDGKDIAYRDIGLTMYLSDDRDFRRRLSELTETVNIEKLNPILQEEVAKQIEMTQLWGYKDAGDWWSYTHEINLEQFREQMEELAKTTKPMFKKMLAERAKTKLGMDISEVKPYDHTILFRSNEYDQYFPKEKLLSTFEGFIAGIGIDLTQQKNILIDITDLPEAEPRPVTYTVNVPDDIRVLVKPSTGLDNYVSLFHEMGHAEHYANCTETKYELQLLGDGGVSETYAFLFEDMLSDYEFLTGELKIPDQDARGIVYDSLFGNLYSLRYYIALLNYEIPLHHGKGNMIDIFKKNMEKYLLLKRDKRDAEASYLLCNEDFYGIYYLEAWLLSHHLEEEYGHPWWHNPQAGEFLLGLYAHGDGLNCQDVAKVMGFDGLEPKYLLDYYQQQYQIATGG
jgi:hypothetical protein